jgi:ribokinase
MSKAGGIVIEDGISSGIAVIEVDSSGENNIIIIPGANSRLETDFIDRGWKHIEDRDIFLLQLEIPVDTVFYTMKRLKEAGKTVILDPAPARMLPDDIYHSMDYITPNETEIEILTGIEIKGEDDMKKAADILLDRGVGTVVAKAGKDGAYLINRHDFLHIPGFRVSAVDTTAAGDSFNAGFAYALSAGYEITECIRIANAVGALSTTSMGAQGAMPSLGQLTTFLKNAQKYGISNAPD